MESYSRLSAHIQCTNSLRSIQLVSTDGQEVNVVLIDIDWDLAYTLGGICVEKHLVLSTDLSYLLYRLDNSDLIVYMDNRC